MRFRTTIWLLVLAAVLWIVVRGVQKREQAREQAILDSRRFLDMTVEEVEFLSIKSPDVDVECRREDGKWFIHTPLRARADASKLERVLSALESLSGHESISADQRRARQLKLEDYGLVSPRARISVGDHLRQRVLSIGDEAPLGDLVYVKLVSATDIVAVPVSFLNVLPPSVESMRDRALLHGDPSEVVRLEIQRPDRGFVQLAAVDGQWMLQQPVSSRANLPHVETILKTLFQLRVEEFVWDPPATATADGNDVVVPDLSHTARLEPYGLAEDEAVRVTVWGEESDQRQELLIGKRTGEDEARAYAKSWDADSIYTVPAAGLDVVSMPVDALRDRAVFVLAPEQIGYVSVSRDERTLTMLKRPDIGWSIIEPLQADADEDACSEFVSAIAEWRILDFIEDAATNLAPYGLESPACTVRLGVDSPAGTSLSSEDDPEQPAVRAEVAPPVTVAIGSRVEGEAAYYVLPPDGEGRVVTLPETMVSERLLDPTRILHFRDRTMLAVTRDRVRRISLVLDPAQLSGNGSSDPGNSEAEPISLRPGQTELSVARDDNGRWVSEQEGAVASAVHVETVLFRMANLRASRIEAMAPDNLARFGLDAPRAMLTLGLTGDTGIQKSLLLGRQTQHGVFAMVRGQDLVFVLNTSVAKQLIAPLVVPATADGEGG